MKFSAVIFDMDGLMLDTERTYRDIFNRAAADCAIEFPESLHMKLLGRNTADMKEILRDALPDETTYERFLERNRHHHAICFATAPPVKTGLMELLALIEERGVPKVVATSTPRKAAIPRLEQCGLLHRFATVSCGDDVEHGKPAPDLFLKAAASIPMEPGKCVVLEDSEAGVIGAHAAGMTVCMVPDLKQPGEDVRKLAQGVYESLVHVRQFLADHL
jgi:beta-phosphoglucomutase-like phosphatase (HAD superfamily)